MNINLDKGGYRGNAVGAAQTRGASAVAAAGLNRSKAIMGVADRIVAAIDKRDRERDGITLVETLGKAEAGYIKALRDLDPFDPEYEAKSGELAQSYFDTEKGAFRTEEGKAAAGRAMASARASAMVASAKVADKAIAERKETAAQGALDAAANSLVRDPSNMQAVATDLGAKYAAMGMPDSPALKQHTTRTLMKSAIRGHIDRGEFAHANSLIEENASKLSQQGFRGIRKELEGAKDGAIAQRLDQVSVAISSIKNLGNPAKQRNALGQIAGNLKAMVDNGDGGPKAAALFERATNLMRVKQGGIDAVAALEASSVRGHGSSQKVVDAAAESLVEANPDNAFDIQVKVAEKGGTLPTPLRNLFKTAGPRSGNATVDAQALSVYAQKARELEVRGVPVPENSYIEAIQTYAETQGIPYEQAAMQVLQNAPSQQEAEAREEYWRQGRAIGVDFRDQGAVQSLGEDMFDQSWFWDPEVSSGFLVDAERMHRVAWTMTGDPEMAKEMAERMLRKRWGYSEATGRVQKMPIEKFLASKMTLPELHDNIGEALRVQMAEDLMEAGVVIPVSADRRTGSTARHGDVKRWEENAYDGVPFRPMWDAESEQHWRKTGEMTWAIQTLNANGTWYAETTTEGKKLRWGLEGIDLTTFPNESDMAERSKPAQDWMSARAYR